MEINPLTFDTSKLYSEKAEQQVLACMLMAPETCDDIANELSPNDFFVQAHRHLFRVILWLNDQGKSIEPLIVHQRLQSEGLAEVTGSPSIISSLMICFTSSLTFKQYCDTVSSKSMLRSLLEVSDQIKKEVEDDSDPNDILQNAEQSLFSISQTRQTGQIRDATACLSLFDEERDRIQRGIQSNRLTTGIASLDRLNNGLPNPGFVVIAAEPGCGKSALAMNFLEYWCRQEMGVGVFSLEMTIQQLIKRSVASVAKIDSRRLNDIITPYEESLVQKARNDIQRWKFWIDPTPNLTPVTLRAKTRLLKKKGCSVVMIDYLQLMKGSEKRFDRREQVAEITRTAKLLANETGMTLVFLAQVNREGRKSGELTLAHLKESSTIEEDADAVLLLQLKQPPDGSPPYPPSYESVTGRWAKYRDGATGQFEMIFNKPHLTFSSTP